MMLQLISDRFTDHDFSKRGSIHDRWRALESFGVSLRASPDPNGGRQIRVGFNEFGEHFDLLMLDESPLYLPPERHVPTGTPVSSWNPLWSGGDLFFPYCSADADSFIDRPENQSIALPRRPSVVMCLSNIISSSQNNLYAERRKAIGYLVRSNLFDVCVAGHGWGSCPIIRRARPNHLSVFFKSAVSEIIWRRYQPTVRVVDDVIKFFSQANFALIFENCVADHYVSEKIYDAIFAGCFPIYLGTKNISDVLNSDLFMQVNAENLEILPEILKMITREMIQRFLDARADFARNPSVESRDPWMCAERLSCGLDRHFN